MPPKPLPLKSTQRNVALVSQEKLVNVKQPHKTALLLGHRQVWKIAECFAALRTLTQQGEAPILQSSLLL